MLEYDWFIFSTLTYAGSGVSIDEGNKLVQRIKALCNEGVEQDAGRIGGFSALIDFAKIGRGNFGTSQIEVGIDGVGTKLLVGRQFFLVIWFLSA